MQRGLEHSPAAQHRTKRLQSQHFAWPRSRRPPGTAEARQLLAKFLSYPESSLPSPPVFLCTQPEYWNPAAFEICCSYRHRASVRKMRSISERKHPVEFGHPSAMTQLQPALLPQRYPLSPQGTRIRSDETKSQNPSTERGEHLALMRRNELPQFPADCAGCGARDTTS